ncbi:MAG: outer membrane protein assembly factor BamA [Bryobacteraceae bacterium]|jgi:outer membrane protein insertion porin family
MRFDRPGCLWLLTVCVCCLSAGAQTQQPSPPQQKKQQNPFESVPQAVEPPKPAQQPSAPPQVRPQMEAPKTAEAPKPVAGRPDVIEAVEFRGARRVPQDTLRAMIFTKKGDRFDAETLRRDFMALWNTGRFDDITLEQEQGPSGVIVRFVLVERPVVRSIKYEGMKSVTVSEILDRFKERHVGLSVESQYDQNKVQRAAVVLKEYLAERGRQYATVTPELRQIPPSSLEVTFRVNEGPKVKVGRIEFVGNEVFSDREVTRAMKNLRPIGIPHSILLENIFAKTYDLSKLEEDKEGIRNFYQDRGYFAARALEQTVTLRKVGGGKFRVPLFYMNSPGIRADISIPLEEGRRYRIRNWNYVGMKLFRVPEALTPKLFLMSPGDVFSTGKFRKGIEKMRDLYGMYGYIDFVPDPVPEPVAGTDLLDVTFNVDEGKQFYIRRIDFTGNTTTRDKVIRRELLVDEGDLFNSKMWEMSVLRLNQLGYFETLKKEDAAQITRDPRGSTVDILLKVKERGKNTIGLTGGVSGIAGSFVGFNYSTNNFLGLGETLSLESQLGTRLRNVTLGFTEPYFLGRPIQLGFTVFTQRFNYDQGREASILTGQNLIGYYQALGAQNLMNYVQNGRGFTVFTSYPLRRSFARIGVSYGYSDSKYTPLTTAATNTFEYLNYQSLNGPNALTGIKTSQITPSYTYNSVNHPLNPTGGRSLSIAVAFANSKMGGNVNLVQPTISMTYFHPAPTNKKHIIGIRLMSSFVSGYGGRSAPPFNRYYIGGEQDVRGFDIWAVSPLAYMPSSATVPVLNSDGSPRMQKTITNGIESFTAVTMTIPAYQIIFPGGDMQAIGNFEYRIPITGPVTLAVFFDAGMDKIVRPDQLQVTADRVTQLNAAFPSAGFSNRVKVASGTQKMRSSTGLELQVLLPVVNAPFRVYWAYNPTIVHQYIQPPIVADRSLFPNQATFINSVANFGQAYPLFEKRSTFRFTIGRTF